MMTGRLILAILSTLLEEVAIVVIVLWGLPQLDIRIPLPGLITLMVAWGAFAVFIYRVGSRALRMKPVAGMLTMVGSRGKAASPLAPDGFVRIKAELWEAKSLSGKIGTGEEVMVVGQDGLKLIVRKGSDDLAATE